ncbi:hypothetical protein [Paracoccus beibuensis]|uniref:hypothetical protein n=1 Tax=Paracoccus beibuensis TaxID=547602 RepID=UPI00223EC681|nr:hypothetical protein [Paracoccus beibuensis]
MSKTITLKRDDLEEVVRTALRLGSQSGGVKHKRLVQGIMEEAEEKAVAPEIRQPIKFTLSEDLIKKLKAPLDPVKVISAGDLEDFDPFDVPPMTRRAGTFRDFTKHATLGEEILQHVERGVPVWNLLQRVTGKPIKELQQIVAAGGAEDTRAAVIEALRKRAISYTSPGIPATVDATRRMSAVQAAFILFMNDIPRKPSEERRS